MRNLVREDDSNKKQPLDIGGQTSSWVGSSASGGCDTRPEKFPNPNVPLPAHAPLTVITRSINGGEGRVMNPGVPISGKAGSLKVMKPVAVTVSAN